MSITLCSLKKALLIGVALVTFGTVSAPGADEDEVPSGKFSLPDRNSPEMAWWRESMQTRDQRLPWWRQARFGMFIHWGVYSGLGGTWQGKPVTGYAEHIQRKL